MKSSYFLFVEDHAFNRAVIDAFKNLSYIISGVGIVVRRTNDFSAIDLDLQFNIINWKATARFHYQLPFQMPLIFCVLAQKEDSKKAELISNRCMVIENRRNWPKHFKKLQ